MKELSNNNDNNHQILQQRPSPAGTEDCNRSRDEGKNSIERNSEEEDLVITTNGAENGSCAAEPFAKVEGSDSQGRGADEADQPDSKRVCVRPIDIVEARTYGTVEEGPVRISNVNLQGNVCLSDEETCVTSFSGYRSVRIVAKSVLSSGECVCKQTLVFVQVRATHGVRQGTWVYEVKIIEPLTDGLGVRVGWVTKDAPLDEPVGANRNGYGFVAGTAHAVHDRQKRAYGSLAALKGDVIGCLLHIPLQKKSLEPVAEGMLLFFGSWIPFWTGLYFCKHSFFEQILSDTKAIRTSWWTESKRKWHKDRF